MSSTTETEDSENIFTSNSGPDDITSIAGCIGFDNFKISILLFILFILISSDVFIDRVLSGTGNYTEGRQVTSKGVLAQGTVLALGYIIVSCLVTYNFI